jgi:predicted transcriptional regulator
MTIPILIDAIMRQTMVLIAQLATVGGSRAPLSHLANQVFVDLARELNAQGVSRKVSADMFGMALRAYIRKLHRLDESSTERGQSLWQAVLTFIAAKPIVSRGEVQLRFHRDEPAVVRGILRDLAETGLVFASGTGDHTVYRAVREEEALHAQRDEQGEDDLMAVLIYREGPLSHEELLERAGAHVRDLTRTLERLLASGRIEKLADGRYLGTRFHIPVGSSQGWEGALLDHYHALVRTLCARLSANEQDVQQHTGGATYTFEVWPGHPHEADVVGTLARFRRELTSLRTDVEAHNAKTAVPTGYRKVVCYVGQHAVDQGTLDE